MNLRIARHRVSIEIGEETDIPLSEFDKDDPKIVAMQLLALPFNDQSIQIVTISHVRTDEEQKAYEGQLADLGFDALEGLEDELG